MNAKKKIKNLLFKLSSWEYLFFLGASAISVTLKGFILGKLFNHLEYATYSYFQIISGLGCIIAGAGIILRYHVEMPVLLKEGNLEKTHNFIDKAHTLLIANTIFSFILLVIFFQFNNGNIQIAVLGVWQAALFLIFATELIKLKSAGHFTQYAKKLLIRNLIILFFAVSAALATHNAAYSALSETLINTLLTGKLLIKYCKNLTTPDLSFIKKTLKFMPLELFGALSQYQDRLAASFILSKMDFARFSYLFILINVGITLQQFINTKLIVNFSIENSSSAFRKFKIGSISLFIITLISTAIGLTIIYAIRIAPHWLDTNIETLALISCIAALKGSDLTQSYMACRHMKKFSLTLQSTGAIIFIVGMIFLRQKNNTDLANFIKFIAAWQCLYLAVCISIIKYKNGKNGELTC